MKKQMRMLGSIPWRCAYGCCREFSPSKRREERRIEKRRERNEWKKELNNEQEDS